MKLVLGIDLGTSYFKLAFSSNGARSDLWLQIKADLLGAEFVATNCREPASLGAAMLAAVGAGWFENLHQAGAKWIKVHRRFTSNQCSQEAYANWFRKLPKPKPQGNL